MDRCPDVIVTPHHGKIQEKGKDFYCQFNIIIAGLDNIDARMWLNSMIFSIAKRIEEEEVEEEEEKEKEEDCSVSNFKNKKVKYDPDTIIPMIDGGTEEFKGQARVIIPGLTACFHCKHIYSCLYHLYLVSIPFLFLFYSLSIRLLFLYLSVSSLSRLYLVSISSLSLSPSSPRHNGPIRPNREIPNLYHRRNTTPTGTLHYLCEANSMGEDIWKSCI